MKRQIAVILSVLIALTGCSTSKEDQPVTDSTAQLSQSESQGTSQVVSQESSQISTEPTSFEDSISNPYIYTATPETPLETQSMQFLTALFSDNSSSCLTDYVMTDEMKAALTGDKLEEFKKTIYMKLGDFKAVFDINSSDEKDYHVVRLNSHFENQPLTLTFSYDTDNKLAGFITEKYVGKAVVKVTDYAIEKQVVFGEAGWQLNGVITVPANMSVKSAVILVHGSGPNDRNETVGANAPFKDIAWALAKQGIATLRYDKRTYTYGQKLERDFALTPDEETVNDVVYASQYLRLTSGLKFDKLYVLGHSLGGYLLPRINQSIRGIDGYIFMNANARPLQELALSQYDYIFNLDGQLSDKEQDSLSKLKAEVDKLSPEILSTQPEDQPILGAYKAYWEYLNNYQPLVEVQAIEQPMLFVQGESDYQVTTEDLSAWQSTVKPKQTADFVILKGLNHLMVNGSEKSTPEDYYIPGVVSDDFTELLCNWINRQLQ